MLGYSIIPRVEDAGGRTTNVVPDPDWAGVRTFVHAGGANGSTVFKDYARNKAIVRFGPNITHSTAVTKFRSSSISFATSTSADFLRIQSHAANGFSIGAVLTSTQIVDFTIQLWVYPTTQTVTAPCVLCNYTEEPAWGNTEPWGASWGLFFNHGGTDGNGNGGSGANGAATNNSFSLWSYQANTAGTAHFIRNSTVCALNTWHHVAITRQNNIYSLFVNGVCTPVVAGTNLTGASASLAVSLDNAGVHGGVSSINSPLYLGKANAALASNFRGYIDDLKITNKCYWSGTSTTFTPPTTADNDYLTGTQTLAPIILFHCNTYPPVNASLGYYPLTTTTGQLSTATSKFGDGSFQTTTNSNLAITATGDAALTFGSNDFTVDAWFNLTSWTAGGALFGVYNTALSAANTSWVLTQGASASSKLRFGTTVASTATFIETTSGTMPYNSWVHVAVTRAGTALRIFINGVTAYTGTVAAAFNVASNGRFAVMSVANGGSYSSGFVEEVRVVNGTAIWTADFTPPTERYVA